MYEFKLQLLAHWQVILTSVLLSVFGFSSVVMTVIFSAAASKRCKCDVEEALDIPIINGDEKLLTCAKCGRRSREIM